MTPPLLPRRAGRSHRNRAADLRGSVAALREAVALDREELRRELYWLATRARAGGNYTIALQLFATAHSMEKCRAVEMKDAMLAEMERW